MRLPTLRLSAPLLLAVMTIALGLASSARATPGETADLGLTKTDSVDPVQVGATLTYTVTVSNAGPQAAANVVVTDTLPAGVTFVSTNGCAEDPNGVPTCTLGSIAAGGSAQYTITVQIDPGTSGTITNSATVSADTPDPNSANNTASVDTVVTAPLDCAGAAPSRAIVWPPDHRMVAVSVVGIEDGNGAPVAGLVTGIAQDEPVDGAGDGATEPDGAGVGTDTAHVRAERAQPGNGRVYHISFAAESAQGGSCSGVVTVTVPVHPAAGPAIDDGPLFDSTASAP